MLGFETKAVCCLGAVVGCTAAGYCAYRHRRKIPHCSECSLIGKCYLLCKIHSHVKFDMLVEVHELSNVTEGMKVMVEVIAGRFDAHTQFAEDRKGRCDVQERMNLHVRQCDAEIEVVAYGKGMVVNEELGRLNIAVTTELISEGFPKRKWFSLLKEGRNTVKVQLSFHKLDTADVDLGEEKMSPLLQQALLHAQYEAEAKGDKLKLNLSAMTDKERLKFYSKVLEGPLKQMSSVGASWTDAYFKPVEKKDGRWEWTYWNSKNDCHEGGKRKGVIPFLSISLVLPDNYDRHSFYVKHHDTKGPHDLVLKRVDRDRNLWSDGLYEFIDRLRSYLEKNPEPDKISKFILEKSKKKKKEGKKRYKSKTSRSGSMSTAAPEKQNSELPEGIRRMVSPRASFAGDAAEEGTRRSSHVPSSASKMMQMSMYGSEEESTEEEIESTGEGYDPYTELQTEEETQKQAS